MLVPDDVAAELERRLIRVLLAGNLTINSKEAR